MPKRFPSSSCRAFLVVGAVLVLGACSFSEDALWPSLSGEEPSGEAAPETAEAAPEATGPEGAAAPGEPSGPLSNLGTGVFEPPGVTPGQPTGTLVGQKVESLRGDLGRLQGQLGEENNQLQTQRNSARQHAGSYHGLVGAMNARLQVGTTPGNPELVAQWNQAQAELQQVAGSIAALNTLANESSSTSALASFLLESTRATFELRGAVEEDHRQLAVLEDEVNKTVVVLDRLLNELTDDIARSQNYFATERMNLTAMQVAIDNGEFIGGSLASRAYGVPVPAPVGGGAALVGQRQPLAVIRFDRPVVDYEPALFTVINSALERRPNAGFDLVAVAPAVGDPARVALETNKSRRNAETVLRSLMNMGLPADRVSLAATSSPQAQVNEVHVYVR